MDLDLAFPTLGFLSLGDLGVDATDLDGQHVLDFGVLVDADDIAMTDDDIFKTLNDCLFENQWVLSAPLITVAEPPKPPAPLVAKRALCQRRHHQHQVQQPPAKRQRNRKRTPQQRERENMTRKAKVKQHCHDRNACIQTEAVLRNRVRHGITAFADAVGLSVDVCIFAHLPLELRYIMWQSDVAMSAYKQFTGWDKLCQTVNGLGNWW